MPQHERGLYEPGEDVRVFDGSEDEEDVEGSRLPLLIVLALLVLAMFAGFVWLAYSEGVARGRGETPVVTAEAGPARVAPQNAGGASEPYKGFKVYEQPAPPDDDTAQNSAPAQHAAPATPEAKPASAAPVQPAPAVAAKVEPPKPAPATKPETPPAPPKVAAVVPPKPVAPVTKAASLPAAPIGPATAPPRSLGSAAAPAPATTVKPVTAAPAPVSSAPAASGSTVLQIGAYKSQADANTAWTIYKGKHASLLAGYSPDIQQADLGDKGTWYRLRIAGFSSRDVASALCDRLKADGGGCFLGK
jgi:SPOR domain